MVNTRTGYTGGDGPRKPTYGSVSAGDGHTEALRVEYDPSRVSYEVLLETFFALHDPSMDATAQYKSAIWPQTASQAAAAQAAIAQRRAASERGVLTELLQSPSEFYAAEWYHQRFWLKNWIRLGLLAMYVLMSYLPPGVLPAPVVAATGIAAAASFLPQLLEWPRFLVTYALVVYDHLAGPSQSYAGGRGR